MLRAALLRRLRAGLAGRQVGLPHAPIRGASILPSIPSRPKSIATGKDAELNDLDGFVKLGVPPFWANRLQEFGLTRPTRTQEVALPVLFARQHAILNAETGSGKTITYLLPILDALVSRISQLEGPSDQLFPVGLIVVPNQELVQQVVKVASALFPEYANMIRPCYGNFGVTRRQNCGIIVATPRAVAENVNARHLEKILYLILDEADALLSGSFANETIGNVLMPWRRRLPEDRPMHIFCAATIPNRGKNSVQAFLDEYYPPQDVVRIATPRKHHILPYISQLFVQLDANIPLTMFEAQQKEREKEKIARSIAVLREEETERLRNEFGSEVDEKITNASATESISESDKRSKSSAEDSSAFFARLEAGMENSSEVKEEEENFEEDDEYADMSYDDLLGRTMEGRALEDRYLQMRADEKRYLDKVAQYRQHATLEALLLPAKKAGLLPAGNIAPWLSASDTPYTPTISTPSVDASSPSDHEPDSEPEPTYPMTRAQRRRGHSSTLGMLTDAPARSLRAEKRESLRQREELPTAIHTGPIKYVPQLEDVENSNANGDASTAGEAPRVVQYSAPAATRGKFTREECEHVPPTLVFVNSAAEATELRKFLSQQCPHLRVAEIHAGVPEHTRSVRLDDFAEGKIRVLVATDVLARGVDTLSVRHVIQASLATDVVSHLHRSGRTGRVATHGLVTNLFTRTAEDLVKVLVRSHESGENIEKAFSRNRSFRKRMKRDAIVAAEEQTLYELLETEQELAQKGKESAAMQ